jgi:NADPH:quinone reductase-like Zn-dependent oxidoreductase
MNKNQQMYSTITASGELKLTLKESDMPTPGPDDVVVRMEAAPINPSDMWPLFGPADMSKADLAINGNEATLTAPVPEAFLGAVQARLDQTLPVGNEGAGVVVATGDSPAAKALEGKVVAVMSGHSFSKYVVVPAMMCLPHNEGTTSVEAASSFVNPLTVLCFLETMRLENHTALVHTAAASNLGQMLVKHCANEGVELVNIVRSQQQVDILKSVGAKHICNSADDDFAEKLTDALEATGATLGFDAALSKNAKGLNTYGSSELKQVYLYGGLDVGPTILKRAYGMSWSVGGWLMPLLLARIGLERAAELRQKVADELKTTFASAYTDQLSLVEAMDPKNIARYLPKKTGEKYLVAAQKDV